MKTARNRHAVMIGLDGVGLGDLHSLGESGATPFMYWLVNRSFASESDVLIPLTAPSWLTISTGVNPGKHGVFDFFYIDKNGVPRPVDKSLIERPLINEIVAAMGLKSIALGVHYAYPPFIRRRNLVISGWTTPRVKVWPPGEEKRVKKHIVEGPPKPISLEDYVDSVLEGLEKRLELAEYYLTYREWKFYYIVFPEPDWLFHYLYREVIEAEGVGRKARRVLAVIDKFVKTVYENMPDNTLLVICSDHGFSIAQEALNGNVLLAKLGFLREKKLPLKQRMTLTLAKLLPARLRSILKYSSLVFIARKAGVDEVFRIGSLPIDYALSKAFMTVAYAVYINPRLPSKERILIRQEVYRAFTRYRTFLEKIEYGDKFFWGPYINRAPDLVLVPRQGYTITTRLMYRDVVEKGRWYVHSNSGVLVMYTEDGDVSFTGNKSSLPKTVDIVPTILVYLGLPLDPDMDGRPLVNVPWESGSRRYEFIARIGKRLLGLSPRVAGHART